MQKPSIALIIAVLYFGTALHAAPAKQCVMPRSPSSSVSCTITNVNDLAAAKQGCSVITVGDLVVPAGETLDLTQLKTGTNVIFTGTVTFGYKQWTGPLVSVSGTKVTVTGRSGHVIDGHGAAWWDGKGDDGKIKVNHKGPHIFTSMQRSNHS